MKASQFTFSANCVINFDDLGQLKDYTPLVEELVNQLQTEKKADIDKLKEVISADYEDLEHVPKFKHLVSLILSQQKFLEESRSRNFLILILKIMQAHFTSYSIQEELANSIFSFLMKYLGNQRDIAFDFFLYISSVIPYLENHEQLISLFIASFNQKDIFSSGYVQIYLKIVDKLMRNLILRKLFLKQVNEDYLYLNFKLSEWAKNNAEMKVFYQRLAEHYGTNEDIVFQKFLAASKVQLL